MFSSRSSTDSGLSGTWAEKSKREKIKEVQRFTCDGTKLLPKPLFYLFWDNRYPVLVLNGGGFLCEVMGLHAAVLLGYVAAVAAPGSLP